MPLLLRINALSLNLLVSNLAINFAESHVNTHLDKSSSSTPVFDYLAQRLSTSSSTQLESTKLLSVNESTRSDWFFCRPSAIACSSGLPIKQSLSLSTFIDLFVCRNCEQLFQSCSKDRLLQLTFKSTIVCDCRNPPHKRLNYLELILFELRLRYFRQFSPYSIATNSLSSLSLHCDKDRETKVLNTGFRLAISFSRSLLDKSRL